MAGPATPASISRSRSIKNDESSSTGATVKFLFSVFRQLRIGPIGEFMGRQDLAQRASVNQFGPGHAAQLRRGIELLQLLG